MISKDQSNKTQSSQNIDQKNTQSNKSNVTENTYQPPSSEKVVVKEKPKKIPQLTEQKARELLVEGNKKNINLTQNGYNLTPEGCKSSIPGSFQYKIIGYPYGYFCSKIDTMDKLKSYLEETFTESAANSLIKHYQIITMKNGKIAGPQIDDPIQLSFEYAKIKFLKITKDTVVFDINPDVLSNGEDIGSYPNGVKTIIFKYVPSQGWRIDGDASIEFSHQFLYKKS